MEPRRYTLQDVYQGNFYQMPKFLFTGEYRRLSNDAKVLYTLLKDRHNLSASNGWVNHNNQVYLIYTREEMADMLGCSLPTVRKAVKQLTKFKLIEEERQGLNRPNLIYLLYVSLDIAMTGENFHSICKESFYQEDENPFGQECNDFSCNNTDINNNDINNTNMNNLYYVQHNDRVKNETVKEYIYIYLEIRSRYRFKQHKRVSDKSLEYIEEVLGNMISNGIDLIDFEQMVEEYFNELNEENDGDIVCFLKVNSIGYFNVSSNTVIV